MKLQNKARFWTGIAMMFVPIISGGIISLTFLDWSWLTAGLVLSVLVGTAILFWLILAAILVWNGSITKEEKPKLSKLKKKLGK